MEYKVENTTANHLIDYWKEEAEQTADHFSEQTRSCTLRENLEKKTAVKKQEKYTKWQDSQTVTGKRLNDW